MKKIILILLLTAFIESLAFAQSIQDTQAYGGIIRNRRTGEKISIQQNIENPSELKVIIEEEGKASTTINLSSFILTDVESGELNLTEHARELGDDDNNYRIFNLIPGHDRRGFTALGIMFLPAFGNLQLIQGSGGSIGEGALDDRTIRREARRDRSRRVGGFMLLPVTGAVNIALLPVTTLTAGFALLAQRVKEHRVEKLLTHLFNHSESGNVKNTSNRMFRFAKQILISRPSWVFDEEEEEVSPPVFLFDEPTTTEQQTEEQDIIAPTPVQQ